LQCDIEVKLQRAWPSEVAEKGNKSSFSAEILTGSDRWR
jgi:hypothetical protein